MLSILTYQVPTVVAALNTSFFRKMGVHVVATSSTEDLMQRAASIQPQVVIVMFTDQGTDDLPSQLRARLRDPRALLLVGVPDALSDWSAAISGYDGVICLEEPEAELTRALVPWHPPWTRRQRRQAVRIPLQLSTSDERPIDGVALDLSPGGARARLERLPRTRAPYRVLFYRSGGRSVTVPARAVWVDGRALDEIDVGLHFLGVTFDAGLALSDLALWEVIDDEQGAAIHVFGDISESTLLWPIAARLTATPVLDLGAVARVNLVGVFRLLEFLSQLPLTRVTRVRRVPAMLMQHRPLQLMLRQRCAIESFYATYDCGDCKTEVPMLVSAAGGAIARRCPICGAEMLGRADHVLDARR